MRRICLPIALLGLVFSVIVGCSDDSSSRRAPEPPPPPPPNTQDFDSTLSAEQVIGGGAAAAQATANLSLNLDDATLSGSVVVTGVSAEAVALRRGFAGERGPIVVELQADSASDWSVPQATTLSEADRDALNAGALYIVVLTEAAPEGALRGQIVPQGVELFFVVMSGTQEVPPLSSMGSAIGAVTLDSVSGAVVVHINAAGLDDAVAAHIHEAVAGTNGPVLVELVQDPMNVAHWFSEDATLSDIGLAAFFRAALYLNLHTPAHPGGEVRGQIVPADFEVLFTMLNPGDVVPPSSSSASGTTATTIDQAAGQITVHSNLVGLDDASAVTVNQAAVGQNGPVLFELMQNPNELSQWSLVDQALDEAAALALSNQGLYVLATSPASPDGALRGQLQPVGSVASPVDVFVVSAVAPADGASVESLPDTLQITFNRDPLESSVDTSQFAVDASGGDGSFGDGNELSVNVASLGVAGSLITLDLTGAAGGEDTYRIRVMPDGPPALTDTAGSVLDGDGDGSPGGVFESTFSVAAASGSVTFSQLQNEILTPSCAVSGCHAQSNPMPPEGLVLSAGVAHGNIVGVPSNQMPTLDRIEPGDPNNSYLVRKVEGTGQGGRMPLGQPALSNELIQNLREWVVDGAQDN